MTAENFGEFAITEQKGQSELANQLPLTPLFQFLKP